LRCQFKNNTKNDDHFTKTCSGQT
jgi:hypothetical protein